MVDDNGLISKSCTRFPTLGAFMIKIVGLDRLFPLKFPSYTMLEWDHSDSRRVDHVIGAFYLVRRSLFEMIGGFDERFFIYLEDLDFSLRAKQIGYDTFYLASVKVHHKGGGTSESIKAQRLFYSLRSRLIYVLKHFKVLDALFVILGTLFFEPISRIIYAIFTFSFQAFSETASGFYLLWRDLPNIIFSRNSGEVK